MVGLRVIGGLDEDAMLEPEPEPAAGVVGVIVEVAPAARGEDRELIAGAVESGANQGLSSPCALPAPRSSDGSFLLPPAH